jgi:hypothetical protein
MLLSAKASVKLTSVAVFSRLCQRLSLLITMFWDMAGVQLAIGRPSVTRQPGELFSLRQGTHAFSSMSMPKGWIAALESMKMIFRESRCRRSSQMASFTATIFVEYKYEVCPKSIRTWAGKKKFRIWVVTIPNPLQSRPLVTPHT